MTYRLIYSSKSNGELTDEDLESILAVARTQNKKAGITGMLLFHDGSFIQVLEGDREKVQSLLKKISADARHSDVELLFEDFETERLFGQWQMAFLTTDESRGKSLGGNFDRSFVDELEAATNKPSQIVQVFFKDLLLDMVNAAKTSQRDG